MKDLGEALDHGGEGVALRGGVSNGGAFGGHRGVQLAHLPAQPGVPLRRACELPRAALLLEQLLRGGCIF